MPPITNGITNPTRIRSQPIAPALRGVTTGTPAGLTCDPGVGVAADTLVVAVAVTAGVDALLALACVVAGTAIKAMITSASTASSTSVVANRYGFSESAGVTRYQCPSHIAVITPPTASAAAKKLATVKTPATF